MDRKGKSNWSFTVIVMAVGLLGAVLAGPAMGGEEDEYFIQHALQKYFDLPQNARSIGMGGAIQPTQTGAAALFGNPAGLAASERVEISLSYIYSEISGEEFLSPPGTPHFSSIDEDLHRGQIQAAIPLQGGENGVVGLGLSLYDTDVNDSVDTNTDGFRLHLGYGGWINDEFAWGLNLAYINDEEDNDFADYEMNDGFLIRPGILYQASEDVTIGMAIFFGFGDSESDIVTGLDGDGDRLAYGLELGFGWQAGENTLVAAAMDLERYDHDADVNSLDASEDGNAFGFHLGIEQQQVFEWLDLRAGYRFRYVDYDFDDSGVTTNLADNIDIHALSAGLSIIPCEYFSLDYGFEYRFVGDGDISSAITLNFFF